MKTQESLEMLENIKIYKDNPIFTVSEKELHQ